MAITALTCRESSEARNCCGYWYVSPASLRRNWEASATLISAKLQVLPQMCSFQQTAKIVSSK